DELGEMPIELQAKLLRAVEEKRIRRVGDSRPVEVDVRIVSATNADLAARMQEGSFRSDLYYRLAGQEVRLPPLRERVGDVPLLVASFLRRSRHPVRQIAPDALQLLEAHPWPGNVRQLESTMRLAVIQATVEGDREIRPHH